MREFASPPLPEVSPPLVGGLADSVFACARSDPRHVVLARQEEPGAWRDVTAAEFRDEVTALAKGLLAEGVRGGDRVAIMARTRYEWTLFDFALWTVGAEVVPVHPTSSAEQVLWMLHETGVVAAMVEHEDHAMTVATVIDRLPRLRRLWQLDAGALGELYEAGAHLADDLVHRHRRLVRPDSIATVVYTSGTTGRPRGCALTHGNLMFEADTIYHGWREVFRPRRGGAPSTLLFLPLAHVFGRTAQVAAVRGKVRFGHLPEPDGAGLLAGLATFRPTFLLTVEHVFERIFQAARRRAEREGGLARFEKAVATAVAYAEAWEDRAFGTGPGPSAALRARHRWYDRAVYAELRRALGGRARCAMSGGAAMERSLGLFFAGAGITVYEGYGLTETTGPSTGNPPGRVRCGTVGPPLPGTRVHIAADGEVWLHGPHVFHGYLDDAKATEAVLVDGWLATGDLGTLDADGHLTITGRKNEVLVTAGGRSVSPSPLEDRVRGHPLVAQCLVVGNDRPYVAALVTLDAEAVAHWLGMRGKGVPPVAELVRDPDLEAEVRRAVVAANTGVSPAESIRTFRILAHRCTAEHGLLTPSRKLKRAAIERAYAGEVEALYRM
ncbi:AMP-dependent synthetase/ligase [Streptomyces sp. NPDC127068]|uniref:AMP-dependent synthetase/ligase n=1 Tax=Streptomyces sp. NPDC127068 TaxID=3347127 RepID=UPI00364D3797